MLANIRWKGGRRWWGVAAGLCLSLIFLVVWLSPAGATIDPPAYVAEFGEPGSGNGQFNAPFGIVVDSSGRILVGDNSNGRIQVFDNNYHYQTSWSGFNDPRSLGIDRYGAVYVGEWWTNTLKKLDANGAVTAEWPLGTITGCGIGITGIVFDSANSVYVVINPQCVVKLNSAMQLLYSLPVSDPISVAVDSHDNVFVAEASPRTIAKFDSAGNLLARFGTFGSGIGQFNYPQALAIDDQDRLFVAEYNNHRVQVFDANNSYLTMWGEWGSDPGQFGWPDSIYVADDGRIFVAEQANSRVQIF